jgi:hypothetical protein
MLHFVNKNVTTAEVVDMAELQNMTVMPVYIWVTKW